MRPHGVAALPEVPPTRATWWPARLRLAGLAAVVAGATAWGVLAIAGADAPARLAAFYVFVTVGALVAPAAILVQVVLGQLLVAGLLLSDAGSPLGCAVLFAGVVLTAELLAVVARLDLPVAREPVGDLRRAGLSATLAGGVFAAIALVVGSPGPSGLFAVAAVAATCVLSARLLTLKR